MNHFTMTRKIANDGFRFRTFGSHRPMRVPVASALLWALIASPIQADAHPCGSPPDSYFKFTGTEAEIAEKCAKFASAFKDPDYIKANQPPECIIGDPFKAASTHKS